MIEAEVRTWVDATAGLEARVLADAPEAVHDARVATRRLRSVLRSHGAVLAAEQRARALDELGWLGVELGRARDAEVLRERVAALVATEPASSAQEQLAADLDAATCAAQDAARATLVEVLRSQRYRDLDAPVRALAEAAGAAPAAAGPADAAVLAALDRDWLRLRRAVRRAQDATEGPRRDRAVHEARKAAKRLRYAAEATLPGSGEQVRRTARAAQALQQLLGEHQDSVTTRAFLVSFAAHSVTGPETRAVLTRLEARELAGAERVEEQLPAAWRRVPRPV